MTDACSRCLEGASGELGHAALTYYVMAPYPGHHVYQCTTCDERWVRTRGAAEGFAWARYSELFQVRKPRAIVSRARVTPS
jgi:hypothetical protein